MHLSYFKELQKKINLRRRFIVPGCYDNLYKGVMSFFKKSDMNYIALCTKKTSLNNLIPNFNYFCYRFNFSLLHRGKSFLNFVSTVSSWVFHFNLLNIYKSLMQNVKSPTGFCKITPFSDL